MLSGLVLQRYRLRAMIQMHQTSPRAKREGIGPFAGEMKELPLPLLYKRNEHARY